MRRSLVAIAVVATLAGCGSSSGTGQLSSDKGAGTAPTQGPIGPFASPGNGCVNNAKAGKVTTTTDLSKKPVIEVPDGPMPCELDVQDIVEGTGPAAKAGDPLTMKYVGALYSTGKQFDASWDRGQDFPFTLGGGMVIAGWDQGLVGMKAGGRRQLIIPPAMGYGDQPQNGIPASSTLIFVVDLVKIG
ncbi:MAG: peptidylprolyl isomerase FKBP-type [Frankiales bacterium]|nr:peptidylprolyl isomerase FKBP-type [Frankiales bacterium]